MKKLGLLVMPLMAMSLLMNCGSKVPFDPLKIDLYKKEIMYDETGENVVLVTERKYNSKRLVKKEIETYPDSPNLKDVFEYTYDKYENETGLHLISYDGKEITSESWMATEYTYDEQSRMSKAVTKMSFDNKDWQVFDYYEYEYQENVEIVKDYYGSGALYRTVTYTYDENRNLVDEKTIYAPDSESLNDDSEIEYEYDEYGCATKIKYYSLEGENKKTLISDTEVTYLNNLWYRPLKGVTTTYVGNEKHYSTAEREYDKKNRITLYKEYEGVEEGDSPTYYFYNTYEY